MLIYIKGSDIRRNEEMFIEYGIHYKKSVKNLKKYHKETKILEMVKNHLKQSYDLCELKKNPISYTYGFEALKYELNGFYSFNLCKSGGSIRLIVAFDEIENIAILEYISMNHYEDFKKIGRF